MSINILDEQFVERCDKINNPEEYQAFLADVTKVAKGYDPVSIIQEFLSDSSNTELAAKALIYLAVQDTDIAVSHTILNNILLSDNSQGGVTAVCLYLVTQRADDDAYFQELLLAPDSFTPPKASINGYQLIKFMGYSGNTRFVDVLFEVLTKHYHFFSDSTTAEALQRLDITIDEEEIPYTRSIEVRHGNKDNIAILTDDKYTGGSHCTYCSFFPCKINRYYAGGIQLCRLENKTDPETLGEIKDYRDWGDHLKSENINNPEQKKIWKQACQLMAKKSYNQAIPYLCSALILEEQSNTESNSSILPLAWIYLSHCFSKCNEKGLAFIAMREALQYKNLIPKSKVAERKTLQAFDNNPVTILGQLTDDYKNIYPSNYEERNQWVKAFDYYVYINVRYGGTQISNQNWYKISECCQELGEFHLAKLFLFCGAAITSNLEVTDFSKREDKINELLKQNKYTGLSILRRIQERTSVPVIEYGFRLDTYQFEKINETVKQDTQNCDTISDYLEVADQWGYIELAIEIMKAAVNNAGIYRHKAVPLYIAANLLIQLEQYDKAKKYLEWAIELDPEDEDIPPLHTYLAKLTPFRKFLLKNGYKPNFFRKRLKKSFKRLKDLLIRLRKRPKKRITGQGKLLKTFTVYKKSSDENCNDNSYLYNDDIVEVVKIGFSWPAFFFTWIWAFVNNMYGLGTVGMVIFMLAVSNISIVSIGLLIILSIIFGIKGNEWKAKHLTKIGFVKVEEQIRGVNKEDAIIYCLEPDLSTKQWKAFQEIKLKKRKQCVFCKYEDANRTIRYDSEKSYIEPAYEIFKPFNPIWCNYHKRYIGYSDSHALKLEVDGSVKVNEWCKGFVVRDGFKDLNYFKSIS